MPIRPYNYRHCVKHTGDARHYLYNDYNDVTVMQRFRQTIETLEPYVPGEQPPAGTAVIKLNTNENPYLSSPRAIDALKTVDPDTLRRYPQPYADEFRQAASDVLGVDPTWILAGNGSDEILTQLMRAVVGPGRAVAYPVPTYVLYRTLAAMQEAPTIEVAYDDAFVLPIDGLSEAGAALTIVANPNSPSGTAAAVDELGELAGRLGGILAIDEAYVEFADASALDLVRSSDRVIVLRTLSKSHSLAGLRLGFGVAQPSLIEGLAKVKDSYNVDAIAAHVAAAAIRDVPYTRENTARIRLARAQLTAALETLNFYVWPSQANFVLARPENGDARHLHDALKARQILVRYFDEPGLADTLRITVGTEDQNLCLTTALTEILDQHRSRPPSR